ncbi:hypothetical protein HK102_009600 [Quaeritorhiza haematococci]|nr:hypothetical protein HK102_009600 [Quaeritorhiza haematococci]
MSSLALVGGYGSSDDEQEPISAPQSKPQPLAQPKKPAPPSRTAAKPATRVTTARPSLFATLPKPKNDKSAASSAPTIAAPASTAGTKRKVQIFVDLPTAENDDGDADENEAGPKKARPSTSGGFGGLFSLLPPPKSSNTTTSTVTNDSSTKKSKLSVEEGESKVPMLGAGGAGGLMVPRKLKNAPMKKAGPKVESNGVIGKGKDEAADSGESESFFTLAPTEPSWDEVSSKDQTAQSVGPAVKPPTVTAPDYGEVDVHSGVNANQDAFSHPSSSYMYSSYAYSQQAYPTATPTGSTEYPMAYDAYAAAYYDPSAAAYGMYPAGDASTMAGSSSAGLEPESIGRLQNLRERHKKEENIQFKEVKQADILGDAWRLEAAKNLTKEPAPSSSSYSHLKPSKMQKKKHNIMYLAFQAKEREKDLAEMASNAKAMKRESQARYGFR